MNATTHMSSKRGWLGRMAVACLCGVLCLIGAPAVAKHHDTAELQAFVRITPLAIERTAPHAYLAGRKSGRGRAFENLSPEEEEQLRRKYDQWQSLPPEKQRNLRRRMKQWNQMSPQQRKQYERRHHQWQQLSPRERDTLRHQLDQWDQLSPKEQDNIRRRFKN